MSFKKDSKIIALILMWILFSPLFLILSIKWSMPKLVPRIILTTLAPLSVLIIFFCSWGCYEYYYFHIKRGSRPEIEAKTGMEFPRFKTIERREMLYGPIFFRAFKMDYTVQLDTTNVDKFYQQINNKIKSGNYYREDNASSIIWDHSYGLYSFSHFNTHENLVLVINSKNGVMRIIFGSE
jgi:hypothetical protein